MVEAAFDSPAESLYRGQCVCGPADAEPVETSLEPVRGVDKKHIETPQDSCTAPRSVFAPLHPVSASQGKSAVNSGNEPGGACLNGGE